MSPSNEPLFPSRGERGSDAAGVETFPWPVVAGYDPIHHWMDQDQAVHAAWQLRDVWQGLIQFLVTLAAADRLAAAPPGESGVRKAVSVYFFGPVCGKSELNTAFPPLFREGLRPLFRFGLVRFGEMSLVENRKMGHNEPEKQPPADGWRANRKQQQWSST